MHDRQVVLGSAAVTGHEGQAGSTIVTKTRPRKLVPRLGRAHTRLGSVEPLSLIHKDVPVTDFDLMTTIFPLATRVCIAFFPPKIG